MKPGPARGRGQPGDARARSVVGAGAGGRGGSGRSGGADAQTREAPSLPRPPYLTGIAPHDTSDGRPIHAEIATNAIADKTHDTAGKIRSRVQTTSPSLGAASVRIQGMRGRYTRFLADGLPLFGQQGGGLGLLQIPPMDLGQVEVIKGVSSALYGAGAMSGVVNLISRRPGDQPVHEFLLNASTLGATDAVAFLALAAPAGSGPPVYFCALCNARLTSTNRRLRFY